MCCAGTFHYSAEPYQLIRFDVLIQKKRQSLQLRVAEQSLDHDFIDLVQCL